MTEPASPSIAVIGLGYVGLPLAVALARHYPVTGFDISSRRIAMLREGRDDTREVSPKDLTSVSIAYSDDAAVLKGHDIFLVTVPTPVDNNNEPDLSPVLAACGSIGPALKLGAIVCFESTVYPGVTEQLCGPVLEKTSGLVCGRDFFLGYSPERINPGDREHTVTTITRVVSGQTPEVRQTLVDIYGKVNGGRIHPASSIMAAEAAKVIENAQRDINIAFVNEISTIFRKLGLSTHDVLEAAGTKWNFLPFTPGLVGGHCIGVDPFYLARCARNIGCNPEVILAGRRTNDGMAEQIASELHALLRQRLPASQPIGKILILGLTFKENVPDMRNSKVADLVAALARRGHIVNVADTEADPEEARREYDIDLLEDPAAGGPYDIVLGAVSHESYRQLDIAPLVAKAGIVADIKGMWRGRTWPDGVQYWEI